MPKFVVGGTIVDVAVSEGNSIREEETKFHVTDGTEEWFTSGELIVESYKPIDVKAKHYYEMLKKE